MGSKYSIESQVLSRSDFGRSRNRESQSNVAAGGGRAEEDRRLMPRIRAVFREHKRRYGARRIARELSSREMCCGARRVGRLMREMELVAIQPKSFRPRTTDSRHRLGYGKNLLLDSSPPHGADCVWVGDITYVPLSGNGFLYLAMLMDLYSRRVVGWQLRSNMKEPLVLAALRSASDLRRLLSAAFTPRLRWRLLHAELHNCHPSSVSQVRWSCQSFATVPKAF